MISDMNLDATSLHGVLSSFDVFNAVVSNLEVLFYPIGKLGVFFGITVLNILVS